MELAPNVFTLRHVAGNEVAGADESEGENVTGDERVDDRGPRQAPNSSNTSLDRLACGVFLFPAGRKKVFF